MIAETKFLSADAMLGHEKLLLHGIHRPPSKSLSTQVINTSFA